MDSILFVIQSSGCPRHTLRFQFAELPQAKRAIAANKKRLAAGAMHKLVPEQSENENVPPSGPITQGGTKSNAK